MSFDVAACLIPRLISKLLLRWMRRSEDAKGKWELSVATVATNKYST